MRTKIFCTIGPASESQEKIIKLAQAGMNVARMNFSHCKHEEYVEREKFVRIAERKTGQKIKILTDLCGPRIRIGNLPEQGINLKIGEKAVFSNSKTKNSKAIPICDPHIHKDLKIGDPIYLANGEMKVLVKKISGNEITTEITKGGTLFSRKGVNTPKTKLTTSSLTIKDIKDARFGISRNTDYIAISFVQSAKDILKIRKICGKTKIISKIETAIALENIDEIIKNSDAIMVARGDLGIETSLEELPVIQKKLIRLANWHNKGTIVATQMMLSMVENSLPTRAEVSDVANAIFDGADAVMLSEETSVGKFPEQTVQEMAKIVLESERIIYNQPNPLDL